MNKNWEQEANIFAVCLLIPKDRLLREIRAMGGFDLCDDEQMKKLANKFGVSLGALGFRLALLDPKTNYTP